MGIIATRGVYPVTTNGVTTGFELSEGTVIKTTPSLTFSAMLSLQAAGYVGRVFVTDVGASGSEWYVNNSALGLVGGSVDLWSSAVAGTTLTGTTSETADLNKTLFGNLLGTNGFLEIQIKYTHTNDANTKTRRVRLGGSGLTGTILADPQSSSNLTTHVNMRIENRNSASSQLGSNGTVNYTASTNAWKTGTVDTTVDCLLCISTQLANSGNSSTLEAYRIVLHRP